MTSSWSLLVNTGSRTCKVTLYDDGGETQQRWLLEGAELPSSPATWLQDLHVPVVQTVHRLVHGGEQVTGAMQWSSALDNALAALEGVGDPLPVILARPASTK